LQFIGSISWTAFNPPIHPTCVMRLTRRLPSREQSEFIGAGPL
jgi:hypothetical protein